MTLTFVPFSVEDVPKLETWLQTRHVKRWWKPHWTAPILEANASNTPVPGWIRPWRIDLDGRAVGYAHDYDVMHDGDVWLAVDGVGPGTRGIDILIGEDVVNKKHGRDMIRALTTKLFQDSELDPACDRVVADPHPDQWGAIIAFRRPATASVVGIRSRQAKSW